MLWRMIRAGVVPNWAGIFKDGVLLTTGDYAAPIALTANSTISRGKRGKTHTISGAISGGFAMTFAPAVGSVVALTGANTGGTTIRSGAVSVSGAGTLGSGAVVDNGVLTLGRTGNYYMSAIAPNAAGITGAGSVAVSATGQFVLDRSINVGTSLSLQSTNVTGNAINMGVASTATAVSLVAPNINVNTNAGTGGVCWVDSGVTVTLGVVGGTANLNFSAAGAYAVNGANDATVLDTYGNVTITGKYTGGDGTLGAVGYGGTLKNTGGLLKIVADASNSSGRTGFEFGRTGAYGGAIKVAGSIEIVGTAGTLVTSYRDITAGGITTLGPSTVTMTGTRFGVSMANTYSDTVANPLNLSVNNTSATGSISNGYTSSTININGACSLVSSNDIVLTGPIKALGGLTVSCAAASTLSGLISGATSLTKAGAGTLTLTATNTYTGATAINAGVLAVQGSATGSAHAVASGAAISAGTTTTSSIGVLTFAAANAKLVVNAISTASASKITCTALTAASGFVVDVLGAMVAGTYPILVSTTGKPTPALGTNTTGRSASFSWSGQTLNMLLT